MQKKQQVSDKVLVIGGGMGGIRIALDLAIVKSIIKAHHGTIKVTSTIGKGTTFTVLLPCRGDSPA